MVKWLDKYNTPDAQNGIEGTMAGLTDKGFNYNGAWGGTMQSGGSLPGSVGFTYARTQDPAPSNGKYAKKTKASAQNGQEMKFYQEGLDWKPKNISQWGGDYALDVDQSIQTIDNLGKVMEAPQKGAVKALTGKYQMPSEALGIQDSWGREVVDFFTDPSTYLGGSLFKKGIGVASKVASKIGKTASTFKKDFVQGYKAVPTREDGGIIEDDRGQWEYPGEITKINSNQITMQGVDYPVLGISDTGDTQMMQPGQDYTYEGESVTEIPMMQNGDKVKRFLNEAKNSIIKGGGNPVSTVVNLVEPSVDLLASTLAPHETIKEREALFNKYRPVEYPNPINITRGLLYPEEQGSPRRDMEGNYDIGEEAWRKALDLPVKENYIIPSQYKPTDAKNPKSKYYTLNNIIDSDKIITEAKKLGWKPGASYNVRSLAPFIKKGAVIDEEDFGNVDPLQQFQLDIDPEGKYASIYDKYDFKYSSLNKIIKPYEFYDRFYLPEKKISKGKKENGGWLSKYN
jgi:hypothetical protein